MIESYLLNTTNTISHRGNSATESQLERITVQHHLCQHTGLGFILAFISFFRSYSTLLSLWQSAERIICQNRKQVKMNLASFCNEGY